MQTTSDEAQHQKDDGFVIPPMQRKKLMKQQRRDKADSTPRVKPNTVYGTKKSTTIRSGPRRHELFVFRVHNEIDDENIKQFLVDENVNVHELERVSREDAWTKSFRVVISSNDLSAVLNADFWPDGIGCRRFWKKKTEQ